MAVGTFAHTRRWAADVDKTLLVRKGHVPVRDGRVCYALGGVEGAQGLEAVSFGARAKAVSADALPEDALLSALGGAVSCTPLRPTPTLTLTLTLALTPTYISPHLPHISPTPRLHLQVSWTAPRSLLQLVQLVPETEDEVPAT